MEFNFNDGGREAAGFKGTTGDCVFRAITIAAQLDYRQTYNELFELSRVFAIGRSKASKKAAAAGGSPRGGVFRRVYEPFLKALGWVWVPTMKMGQGCRVHLKAEELPPGRLIVVVSKHLCAVINGVVNDTYQDDRGDKRCVYGFYYDGNAPQTEEMKKAILKAWAV